MRKNSIISLLVIFVTAAEPVSAQESLARNQVNKLMEGVRQVYLQPTPSQMTISYYYANEHKPAVYLDSLQGELILQGNSYRMKMAKVETIVNERYSITLFEADKLMYLARPAAVASHNPLASADSILKVTKDVTYAIRDTGANREAILQFLETSPYKKITFLVDTASGRLLQSKLWVKTSYMLPDLDKNNLEKEGLSEYSIVESRLSNYKIPVLAAGYFDDKQFFTRTDNQFDVTETYRDYKIFVATPNL